MDNQSSTPNKNVSHPFNKKAVIIAAAIVIAILLASIAAVIIDRNNSPSTTTSDVSIESSPVTELIITNDGINPDTITVTPGTQVQFTNNADTNILIIQSPADEVKLDEFDSEETTTKGGSYAYVFEDEGTFNIQDKNDPTKFNAIVIVKTQTTEESTAN